MLKQSPRCYYWLFIWSLFTIVYLAGVIVRGFTLHNFWVEPISALVFGYMFFIDISHKIWWTADQIWWRGWDYLSIKPMRHSVRIDELSKVVAANHPANFMADQPFDRFELVSPTDTITILPSFHRREELEELLRLIHAKRPEAFVDPQVLEFMDGGFTEWWRYR